MSSSAKTKKPKISFGRSKGRRTLDAVEGFATSIGAGSVFIGDVKGQGHSIVLGRVEGNCELDGTLVIGESGYWQGDIHAQNVIVAGSVVGEVNAKGKLEILSTARIKGTLVSSSLAIAEGAIHEGEVKMTIESDVTRFTDRRES